MRRNPPICPKSQTPGQSYYAYVIVWVLKLNCFLKRAFSPGIIFLFYEHHLYNKVIHIHTYVSTYNVLHYNHAWESRLAQPKLSGGKVNGSFLLRPPGAEKMTRRSTNMNVLYMYILIIVTKIGECYSAKNRLPKLIIETDVFLCSLFGQNRVFSYFMVLLFTISVNIRNWEQRVYISIIHMAPNSILQF